MIGSLAGRMPQAMTALSIALITLSDGGSYTKISLLTAAFALGLAAGQPLLGRAIDHHDHRRVLIPAVLLSAAGYVLLDRFGTQTWLSLPLLLITGFLCPPLAACVRAVWPAVLPQPVLLEVAYAAEASLQQVTFVGGPLLVTGTVALLGTRATALVAAAFVLTGTLLVVLVPVRLPQGALVTKSARDGPWRVVRLRMLYLSLFCTGAFIGVIWVATVVYSHDHAEPVLSGVLVAALAFGALVGGGVYGRMAPVPAHAVGKRMVRLTSGFATCALPLATTPAPAVMGALMLVAGVFLAPVLACSYTIVQRFAPSRKTTEAFAWLASSLSLGSSAGQPLPAQ
ncbi:MFS transporter [Streptomyces sp. NPDC048362]|uniref:MFS transporter n=1 Tax=Streptomyces sp. NPDC048362 TaxID=3365539 RepID=UPI003720DCD3